MLGTPVVETLEFCQLGSRPSAAQCVQGDLSVLLAESKRLAGFVYSKGCTAADKIQPFNETCAVYSYFLMRTIICCILS